MAFQQETIFAASMDRLFQVLTSEDEFSKATGAMASIDAQSGGAFSCFNDQIVGRFLEVVPNKRIVQAWRVAAWPQGVFSIVRFDLAGEDGETKLTLHHAAYPEDAEAHLQSGWVKMYWEPIKAHLR